MKRTVAFHRYVLTGLLSVIGLFAVPAAAADMTQTITLHPGWNAIHVEVEPSENDIGSVFAGVPVASVWRWIPSGTGGDFIADPAEGLQAINGWFAWFPEGRPEAFLTNLFTINGNTAYLVKLEGSANRQLVISGRPVLKSIAWKPNGFTLTGLPVSPSTPPSFAEFFSASTAHAGQPVYKLDNDGRWRVVSNPSAENVESGHAYWVYTEGNSEYQGRMRVVLDQGESLEFSAALTEMTVVLRNMSSLPGSFELRRIGGGDLPLSYLVEDPETGEKGWPAIPQALNVAVPANDEVFLNIAVRRRDFSLERMDEIFAITDELGDRVLLYAGGNSIQPAGGSSLAGAHDGAKAVTADTFQYAGLWVGDISIDAVSEAQMGGTTPVPVGRPFEQRFLIHVDSSGKARLLKDVIQMWEDGITQPSSIDPTLNEVAVPGHYVLVTDKALLSQFSGAAVRDGSEIGVRYSTVAYDFDGQQLDMGGAFGPGEQLTGTLVVASDLPTNPFLHRYHPDHNNLDEQFLNPRIEAYQVVRNVQLIFTENDPDGANEPGWGSTTLGGEYHESITGLHKNAIFTSGEFRLHRASAVPVLNQ